MINNPFRSKKHTLNIGEYDTVLCHMPVDIALLIATSHRPEKNEIQFCIRFCRLSKCCPKL